MTYFGKKLRTLRLEHGMSQSELAEQLGMTKSRINMYERGEREPRFEIASRIAAYFGADLNDMLGIPRTMHIDRVDARQSTGGGDSVLSSDEEFLLSTYRALSDAGRDYVRQSLHLAQLLDNK